VVRMEKAGSSLPAPEVFRIHVPKEKLLEMPQAERCFLLLLGYCSNQIILFQKLVYFSTNQEPEDQIDKKLRAANTQMILRHFVGVIHEAFLLISRRFLSSPLGQTYLPLLDENGRATLDELKKMFGSHSLISRIRNSYAFHYPTDDELDQAFAKAAADKQWDDEWNWYFSHASQNSFYFLSDIVTLHGLYGPDFASDPTAGHETLMSQVGPAGRLVLDFAAAFIAATWKRHIGSEMTATEVKKFDSAPDIEDVYVPFFVRVPPAP